jgi:4-amino-4-deoxy-L-arabinose transferase-like glycosyltransferase
LQSAGASFLHPDVINKRPLATFVAFAALHMVVWTLLPGVLYPNLPLDLIEALTYGREWQLGYDKLPPLPWWIVESLRITIGYDFAYYTFSQLTVIVTLGIVWITAAPLVGTVGALLSVLIIDSIHYVNYSAAKFNHDVVQLPFWALAGYSFLHAMKGGRLVHWVLLGVAIGLSLWAKYFVVILAAPMILFAFLDPQARRCLRTPGPWVASAVALLVMAPHLLWLVQNDFLPFAYANSRAAPSRGFVDHIWHPLLFVLSQIFFMLPAFLVAAPLFIERRPRPLREMVDSFERRIVTLLAFGPCAALLALSAVTGRGVIAMWGYPLWLFVGLWMVMFARDAVGQFQRVAVLWAIVFLCVMAAFAVNYTIVPYFDQHFRAVFYPGEALAGEISQRFRAATGQPLAYVIGNIWDGGNVAHYAPERPRVLIDGKLRRAPWIDLNDLREKGAVVVWVGQEPQTKLPQEFRDVAANAQIQEPIRLRFLRGDSSHTGVFSWAIVPPRR